MECRAAKAVHLYQIPWLTSLSAKQLRTRLLVPTCDYRPTSFARAIRAGEAAAECSAATRETYAALHLAGMAFCLGADDRISAVEQGQEVPPSAFVKADLHHLPLRCVRFLTAPLGACRRSLVDGHSFELMLPQVDRWDRCYLAGLGDARRAIDYVSCA